MIRVIDSIYLFIAMKCLNLYNKITGKTKYTLARYMLILATIFELGGFSMESIENVYRANYLGVGIDSLNIIILFVLTVITLYEYSGTQELEKAAKEAQALVPVHHYKQYSMGFLWLTFGVLFIPLSIPILLDGFPDGIDGMYIFIGHILRGTSMYVIQVVDCPPGKSILERIKNKLSSFTLVPATMQPVPIKS